MTTKTLTGIGECMIELSAAADGNFRKSFAGDVFNTLHYARQALPKAWAASFYSGLGTDPQSDEMRAFLNASGIVTDQILTVPGRVPGLYMIHLDGAERSFSYWRDSSAARMMASDKSRLSDVIQSADALYISGITLAILPLSDAAFLIDALKGARDAGKTVAFDPNIRPKLWANPDEMRGTITRAAQSASIILPSFDDEQAAFGDTTPMATAQRYAQPETLIIVKNGSAATHVTHNDLSLDLPPPPVATPVDTTGAGDSFNGAFLGEYLKSGDVEASVKAGQACAARVICQHGAII